nr:uncharacterized protein LOC111507580 isoform X1 [Leptinotarsa decemlineata]
MIFTLFYMYATFIQWWRLGSLKNKLNGTLTSKNALLVCDGTVIYEAKKSRSFETLLFRSEDRIGCTIVPKQKINLSQWVTFPRDYRYFPILFQDNSLKIASPSIYILIETMLDTYLKHSADLLQVENFGELVAWRASDYFEAILKTDLDKLTKIVHCFSQGDVDINHELKLLKIETVDIEGIPTKIKYDRKYSKESVMRYSHAPIHWKVFAENLKEMYSRVRDSTNPKITIENGKSDEIKKVPVSEVKPIKKDSKKTEDKNTLEVTVGDYRRHKSSDHKRDKHAKTDGPLRIETKIKDEHKHKTARSALEAKIREHKREAKNADDIKTKKEDLTKKDVKDIEDVKKIVGEVEDIKEEPKTVMAKKDGRDTFDSTVREERGEPRSSRAKEEEKPPKRETSKSRKDDQRKDDKLHKSPKVAKTKSKADLEKPDRSPGKSKTMSKRTTSSEKKLVKSMAVCDDDSDKLPKKDDECVQQEKSCSKLDETAMNEDFLFGDGQVKSNGGVSSLPKSVKPPNILIYADSLVAKENVRSALVSMLNKDKYTIYDLPTDPNQMMWNSSTVLVVICGSVPPNLTFHLLQFLLCGGQLLCLCSDFLYSVLHTFTTAEVREHELVRFTYGKWKQVKMMHHIFCYQASPTKKQFSKDSDHSNQSSGNGSSPIAPRTPSAVEIQHNGKNFVIQVQVLGTEETWQTPSLLLATVKGGEGRAIFSQVHLEIDPNEYEDDEKKFEALKDSDQARLEILGDILSNHLDIDCRNRVCDIVYAPAYFLGRHDMKLKLLDECDSIKEKRMECDKVSVKFCGKDEDPGSASSSFMPILIHSCPSNFSTVSYFEALETERIGRLVLYSDVMTSSQHVLSKKLAHGLVVIPRQQTEGIGRSNNHWLSPIGSAMFSLQLHIPLASPLGKVLPLVQHFISVAVVSAIKTKKGYQNLDIGIKWPNDLYANKNVKIGGVLVSSFTERDVAVINVGCGINLDNPNPTICINDLIRMSNQDENTSIKTISYETYFAEVFNELERIYEIVQGGDTEYLYDMYYKYWLHNDSEITVKTKEGSSEKVRIVGIDDYGHLRVRAQNGSISTVHPDGNSFDMLKGLVSPKVF